MEDSRTAFFFDEEELKRRLAGVLTFRKITYIGSMDWKEKMTWKILIILAALAGILIVWCAGRAGEENDTAESDILREYALKENEWASAQVLISSVQDSLVQAEKVSETEQTEADEGMVSADGYTAPDLEIQNVEINISPGLFARDSAAIGILLVVSVSFAGITIMRKKPKEILSEMS